MPGDLKIKLESKSYQDRSVIEPDSARQPSLNLNLKLSDDTKLGYLFNSQG